MTRTAACLLVPVVLCRGLAFAGQNDLPVGFAGPPPPALPQTIARDASGRVTIRAVRLDAPLRIDGRLDEAIYASVRAMSDFVQSDPIEGVPATEKTEVWVFYDRNQIYVSARCWETRPDRMVVTEMRRDNPSMIQNENVAFMFDPFFDRRNALVFTVNPIGARTDAQVTNERQYSRDWNAIWDVEVGRFEGGWTVEAAVPFKSLRYQPGEMQIWGFNVQRVNRWKNEVSHLAPIPRAIGRSGIWRASLAATMVGLEAPPGSKNLEIKPYAVSSVASDVNVRPRISNDVSGDIGVDAKYGVTQNLTADFTYNTDFAQVEADEQQINLTRFSLFFPEKREFFLENSGLFGFGGIAPGAVNAPGNVPILFYSRRIGLNQNRAVPIVAGGRFTGRVGRFNVGALNIYTDDEPVSGARPTGFSVVRVKRDVLQKSSIGLLLTGRSVGQSGAGRNLAYGVDGTFSFFNNLAVNTYWARTETDGLTGDNISYRAQLDYAGDRYGVQVGRLSVGDHFNPEVGFLRRDDMRQTSGSLRFSPRPKSSRSIRRFSWIAAASYIENGAGRLDTRNVDGEFAIEFNNSDRFDVGYARTYELVPRPFPIASGVTVPVGAYDYSGARVSFNFGQHRRLFGNVQAERGTLYGGERTAVSLSQGRMKVTIKLSVEPTYSVNHLDLPQASFTTHLAGSRVTYTMTPLMFVSALVQYNSDSHVVMANARLRWEYRPGSELFVVYNDQRDTRVAGFPALANRALIVKINRLFRF